MPLCDKAGIISNVPLVSFKYLGGGELYSQHTIFCSMRKSNSSLPFSLDIKAVLISVKSFSVFLPPMRPKMPMRMLIVEIWRRRD